MSGEVDPLYAAARTVLLDALEALGPQREALILVGAQAIYMHTGAYELAVAEYTTDADITIDPGLLKRIPEIEAALTSAGFFRWKRVGAWAKMMSVGGVPAAGHGKEVARKARGFEAALVDKSVMSIQSLDVSDTRVFSLAVSGPAALLVSKLHKIAERLEESKQSRLDDKDALDILRILQAVGTADLVDRFLTLLAKNETVQVTHEALQALNRLFSTAVSAGSVMAARAVGPLAVVGQIEQSCAVLATQVLRAIRSEWA
ncbi:MAG: hypothetical protein HY820_39215 [Acidobacteria bacterium]|nr:hypothetical protein [Acidobacteriota bacterium]